MVAADIDESAYPGEEPTTYALRLAAEKSAVVAAQRPAEWVLAADTVVELEGSTCWVPPGWWGETDDHGTLVLRR